MHPHHIAQMVHALKPVLKNRAKAQAILERYWRNRMAIVWEIADVHRAANECELALTNAEAREVLQEQKMKQVLQVGQSLSVRVIKLERETRRMGLSLEQGN